MQWVARRVFSAGVVLVATPALSQVQCTMPNGIVIEQRLSDVCPQGAIRGQKSDGERAEIRGVVLTPPQPVRRGAAGGAVQTVSRAEFGNTWPLTVDAVELRCVVVIPSRPDLAGLVFEHNNRIFTLNGIARGHAPTMGWHEIGDLWRDNRAIEGTKVPITPLIERAGALCSAVVPPAVRAKAAPVPASDDGGLSFFGWFVVLGGVAALIAAIRGSAAKAARKQ